MIDFMSRKYSMLTDTFTISVIISIFRFGWKQVLCYLSKFMEFICYFCHVFIVVVDLPLLRVAVEGSDNPISLEKLCQASLPPDQQRHHSLQRSSPGLDSMSPARSRSSASHAAGTHGWPPKKLGGRASGEAG